MKGTSRRIAVAATAAAAAALAMPVGAAAEETLLPDWKFGAIVYGWFPPAADRSAPPSQDAGPWGLSSGFASLGFDGAPASVGLSPRTAPGQLAVSADVLNDGDNGARSGTWSLLGSYALVTEPHNRMELLGGARYLSLAMSKDGRVARDVAPLPAHALDPSMREADTWDAVVGARGRYRFGEGHRWFLPYYLDVGAGQSNLTWQAMGGIGYAFSWGEVFASYRHLDYRFATESRLKSLSYSGPGVTFGVRW